MKNISSIIVILVSIFWMQSCTHDDMDMTNTDPDPMDTTMVVVCDTEGITYSGFVSDVLEASCNGCHSTSFASGGIVTDNYEGFKTVVDGGRLLGALRWDEGFSTMPQDGEKLDSCIVIKIKSWIDAGAENN